MIYHIYANRSNIGDWLSAKGIQKLLSPLPITECLCDLPYLEETIKQLNSATGNDLIVIGGGGLFMDYFMPFWKAFLPIAQRVPYVIWGAGCCDLKREETLPSQSLMQDFAAMSKLCVVRDEFTRNFLNLPNLPAPVPCPAFHAIEPITDMGFALLHVNNYSTAGADVYEEMRKTGKEFAKFTGRPYSETNNRIKKRNEPEMSQLLLRYQQSDIILSSALHGCIIGVAMGKKVVAVSGDRKIDEFMKVVGLKDWVLSQDETHLLAKVLNKLHHQNIPSSIIENIWIENKEVAKAIKNIIGKAIQQTLLKA